jgi:hypothetical protein
MNAANTLPLTVKPNSLQYNRFSSSRERTEVLSVRIHGQVQQAFVSPIALPLPFRQNSGENPWEFVEFLSNWFVNKASWSYKRLGTSQRPQTRSMTLVVSAVLLNASLA